MKNRLSKKDDLPLALRLLSILLLVLVVVLMGLPMLNVLAVSLSTQAKSDSPGLVLLPAPPTFEGYTFIWKHTNLPRPFFNTVYVSVVGK